MRPVWTWYRWNGSSPLPICSLILIFSAIVQLCTHLSSQEGCSMIWTKHCSQQEYTFYDYFSVISIYTSSLPQLFNWKLERSKHWRAWIMKGLRLLTLGHPDQYWCFHVRFWLSSVSPPVKTPLFKTNWYFITDNIQTIENDFTLIWILPKVTWSM